MHLRARAHDNAPGRPDALGGVQVDAGRAPTKAEDVRDDEPVAERAGEPADRGTNVDRPAELIKERVVLGR